jgi:hypothetical protein
VLYKIPIIYKIRVTYKLLPKKPVKFPNCPPGAMLVNLSLQVYQIRILGGGGGRPWNLHDKYILD